MCTFDKITICPMSGSCCPRLVPHTHLSTPHPRPSPGSTPGFHGLLSSPGVPAQNPVFNLSPPPSVAPFHHVVPSSFFLSCPLATYSGPSLPACSCSRFAAVHIFPMSPLSLSSPTDPLAARLTSVAKYSAILSLPSPIPLYSPAWMAKAKCLHSCTPDTRESYYH